jgi:hypothetical protein
MMRAFLRKSSSPSFRLMLLTIHFPWQHRKPASTTAKFDESMHRGTCRKRPTINDPLSLISTVNKFISYTEKLSSCSSTFCGDGDDDDDNNNDDNDDDDDDDDDDNDDCLAERRNL